MSKHISSLMPAVLAKSPNMCVHVMPLIGRISLRIRQEIDKFDDALGIELPRQIGARSSKDGIEALCLGPDEWTLLMPIEKLSTVQNTLAGLYASLPHSMTEVTGREITFAIEGEQAETLLSIGCPRDIRTIKIGQARRTLFDGATVVIWCDAHNKYRMDVWNSFAPFVAQTLETGVGELAAELTQS